MKPTDPPSPALAGDTISRPVASNHDAEIEARVQQRTERLEAKVRELEAFSYSVAHDLRSPLRGISGFTRILIEDHTAGLDGEGRRILGAINRASRRMEQLIDDFIGFSRLSRKPLDFAGIDMTELARGSFRQLVETALGPVPLLEVGSLPPTYGDRSMVRQIFANLLDNAIKFTQGRPASRIEVTGHTAGDWNIYCVADNGVGFEAEDAPKLFGVFQRLHHDFEGTGIGLAVVQAIVLRHGGKAWAEGKTNAGAKFYFTLPVHPENTHDQST